MGAGYLSCAEVRQRSSMLLRTFYASTNFSSDVNADFILMRRIADWIEDWIPDARRNIAQWRRTLMENLDFFASVAGIFARLLNRKFVAIC